MDSGLDSSLAVINNHYYARYQVPRFARIPRKPVSPSLYSADVTFSDEADDEITELRNPLGRIARVMNAQASGPRPSTATTVAGDGTPPLVHTRISRPKSCQTVWGGRLHVCKNLVGIWAKEIVCLFVSLICFVGM